MARTGIFVGFPPDPGYDSVNALRQVFEGLQCGQPSWSVRFMTGVPGAFWATGGPSLASFTLRPRVVSLDANEARLAFQLNAVIDLRRAPGLSTRYDGPPLPEEVPAGG